MEIILKNSWLAYEKTDLHNKARRFVSEQGQL